MGKPGSGARRGAAEGSDTSDSGQHAPAAAFECVSMGRFSGGRCSRCYFFRNAYGRLWRIEELHEGESWLALDCNPRGSRFVHSRLDGWAGTEEWPEP